MSILKKLSLKSLRLNKKRSIGTIIGIILSTSLICAVAGMFTSFQKTLVNTTIKNEGYYHLQINNITNKDLKDLNANRKINNIKTMYNLGYALYNETDKENPYIQIYSSNDIKDLSFHITSGRVPINNNEIIITKKALTSSNLKIGDTLTLYVGQRITDDGYILNNNNPYYEENNETIKNGIEKTYKIVGTFEKRGYNYDYVGITTKENNDNINAFISLNNPKNYKKDIPNILGQKNWEETETRDLEETKYIYEINRELLRWEVFAFSDSTISMITTVVGVVIIIIIISSVFCIRNSFAISVTEKTKMYGMMSSIGATKKQIKRSILYEGLILGIIGVPLGIISGLLADYILIKIINIIFKNASTINISEFSFDISLISIILSFILGFITIYLSCISTARKASKISPIQNITNSADIKLNYKKLKSPKIINSCFGVGGVLAYKNLKRSKKKYRTTVISITISVFVFISMNAFLTETFDLSDKYYTNHEYNLEFNNINKITNEEIEQISKIEHIKNIHAMYEIDNHNTLKIYDKSKINLVEIGEFYKDCYTNENDETVCSEEESISMEIISLDEASYKKYIKKLGYNYEDIKSKGILVDEYKYYDNGEEKNERIYNYKNKEKIIGKFKGEDISIEIGGVSSIRPYGIENTYFSGGYLVLNKEYFKDLGFKLTTIMINSDNVNETIKYIEKLDSDVYINNFEEDKKQDEAMKLIISIFLYGFITVITLIGVTSIFNTITSNMELRSKEFGVLKSIGMTKKEFKHMINLETIFYSFKSLIFGILLGLIGSYTLQYGFSKKTESSYQIPLIPILISIIFVLLLVYIIMKFSISKINKQNTIETIRNDNI